MTIVVVQAKSTQKWYFLVSKPILKIFFLGYFYPPTLQIKKNWVKMVPKQGFTGADFKSPPFFQRHLQVGLNNDTYLTTLCLI